MTELGRKQSNPDVGVWQRMAAAARQAWPDPRLDHLVDTTVLRIQRAVQGRTVAYAWSGGKDSLALEYVCRMAGIEHAVLAISRLEFPAMLRWITDHMPPGLTVVDTGQDLEWLKAHPKMLFPQGVWGPKWFTIVNHRGQDRYYRDHSLDMILLGRRRSDGNFCGRDGIYTNAKGVTRFSPLADWPHEAVFALIDRERIDLPPCYGWPRGYQVGTGSWPARQWTRSVEHGWSEVWEIDPQVVVGAAQGGLESAERWLNR